MDFDLLEIPTSKDEYPIIVDKGNNFYQSKIFLELLSVNISQQKIIERMKNEKLSIKKLLFSPVISECSIDLNYLRNSWLCIICKENVIEITTVCSHGYCKECLISYIKNETNNYIILNENESNNTMIISARCKKCLNSFTIDDLKLLFSNITQLEMNANGRKTIKDIEEKECFICMSCEINRGKKLFINDPCLHMCKMCISYEISLNRNAICKFCKIPFSIESILQEKHKCYSCRKEKYLVGDYLQELCPNYLYCLSCVYMALAENKCFCHNKRIKTDIKVKIYSFVLKTCLICKNEQCITSFSMRSCCDANICYDCLQDAKYCLNCNSLLTLNLKENLRTSFIVLH